MKVRDVLETITENTNVEIYERESNLLLGCYDGKNTITKCLLSKVVNLLDCSNNTIQIYIDFNVMKFLDKKDSDSVIDYYINWTQKKVSLYNSNYGILILEEGNPNRYLYTSFEYLNGVIYDDEEFLDFVLKHLELVELELTKEE